MEQFLVSHTLNASPSSENNDEANEDGLLDNMSSEEENEVGSSDPIAESRMVQMKCDPDGWTVIQSRGQFGNLPRYFFRSREAYQDGFGEPGTIRVNPS